jgi:hypothetical protein
MICKVLTITINTNNGLQLTELLQHARKPFNTLQTRVRAFILQRNCLKGSAAGAARVTATRVRLKTKSRTKAR